MKKIIIAILFCSVSSLIGFAQSEIAQFIITDCGTVRSIPSNSTEAEACRMLDYWSAVDC